MEKIELKVGYILQINENHQHFPGFFLVVTEPKSYGAQGYLLHSREFDAVRFKGKAFLRVKFEDVELCGRVCWIEENSEKEEDEKNVIECKADLH